MAKTGLLLFTRGRTLLPLLRAGCAARRSQHAAAQILMAHTAAAAEPRKMEREQHELAHVVDSLRTEALELATSIASLEDEIEEFVQRALDRRPTEASLRISFETTPRSAQNLASGSTCICGVKKLANRRAEIDAASTKSERDPLPVGLESTVLFELRRDRQSGPDRVGLPGCEQGPVRHESQGHHRPRQGQGRQRQGCPRRAACGLQRGRRCALHRRAYRIPASWCSTPHC